VSRRPASASTWRHFSPSDARYNPLSEIVANAWWHDSTLTPDRGDGRRHVIPSRPLRCGRRSGDRHDRRPWTKILLGASRRDRGRAPNCRQLGERVIVEKLLEERLQNPHRPEMPGATQRCPPSRANSLRRSVSRPVFDQTPVSHRRARPRPTAVRPFSALARKRRAARGPARAALGPRVRR
jgi:hypothetical protein